MARRKGTAPVVTVRIIVGDALEQLRTLPDASVRCCVTSPPYWGLRDYGVDGQIGLEPTPELYVAAIVGVFREVRRVLADDGTLWINLGDSLRNRGGRAAILIELNPAFVDLATDRTAMPLFAPEP